MDRHTFPELNAAQAAFSAAEMKWLADVQSQHVSTFVSPDNMQRFSHGRTMLSPAAQHSDPGELVAHKSEWIIRFEDVRNNNVAAWLNGLAHVVEQMRRSFMQMLIETMEKSTEKSGNTVNAREHLNKAAAFLEIMKKIEFGVNRLGEVVLPQMLVGEGVAGPWIAEMEAQPQEFKDELERVKSQKTAQALERDQERRRRFAGLRKGEPV